MKRGIFEPRVVVNDELTKNEQKVYDAWLFPETDKRRNKILRIAEETGFTTRTVIRHLGTIEKWLDAEEIEK